jgi:hypothetical protein
VVEESKQGVINIMASQAGCHRSELKGFCRTTKSEQRREDDDGRSVVLTVAPAR